MSDFPNDLNITVRNEHFFGENLTVIINNDRQHSNPRAISCDDELEIFGSSSGDRLVTESRVNVNNHSSPVQMKLDSPTSSSTSHSSYSSSVSANSSSSGSEYSDDSMSSSDSDSSDNSSSLLADSRDSTLCPIFISDGIAGDLNSVKIMSKCFPAKSYQYILNKVMKTCNLNRDIWLSVGNYLPLLVNTPSIVFQHLSKRIAYRKSMLVAFRAAVTNFKKSVEERGGRVFLVEVFPSPRSLNPDSSKVPDNFYRLAWKIYLGLNVLINDLNREFGHTRTLNFNSYLRHRISMRKGKVRSFNKSVFEISSEEEEGGEGPVRDRRQESKLKEGLHHSNGFSLLEPTRLVIVDIISRAILGS